MGNIVGIDLGTTNSLAAFKFSEQPQVVKDEEGRQLIRSMVAVDQNKIVVGEKAYNQLGQGDTDKVIVSIKRLMGRGFNDPVIQQQLSRFHYKITQSTKGTGNSLSVWLGGTEYEPEDISAEILKKVVQNAQQFQQNIGQKSLISQAVITIPAYFNDKQRYATQVAAQKAGLTLRELLPEPTAAAISYGFNPHSEEVETILVYDFGGGTLDCSIITAVGNQFIESAKAGDLWLGGDDFDNCIIEYVKQEVARQEELENIDTLINRMPHYQRVRLLGELKVLAERAKIDLSSQPVTQIQTATPLFDQLGMAIYIDVTLTREKFEELITPLVERSVKICVDTIKYSEYPLDQIDVILLVGGSTQVPLVQRKIREAFPTNQVKVHPRPMLAVAEGAAIVAAGLTEKVTTVSRNYCIELVDHPRFPLIKPGDILPIKQFHTFKTEADGQRLIHFKFFSPDQVSEDLDHVKRDERIGEMWLALDKAYPKGTEVIVAVELDEKNNSLQLTATLKNNSSIKVSCSFSRGREDEQISWQVEDRIKELNQAGNLTEVGVQKANEIAGEIVKAANQIYLNGNIQGDRLKTAQHKLKELDAFACEERDIAQFYLVNFEFVLEACNLMLHPDQKQRLQQLVSQLKQALERNDGSALQKLSEDAKREFDNLPDEIKRFWIIRETIGRTYQINPSQARVMDMKFSQMLNASQRGDQYEANRCWSELQPLILQYLDRDLPTGTIATGLTQ